MSNTEFFIIGLILLVLSNVIHNKVLGIFFAILSMIYITVSLFRKEKNQ
jgi:hypothetical protein